MSEEILRANPDDSVGLGFSVNSRLWIQEDRLGPFWDKHRQQTLTLARKAGKLYPQFTAITSLLAWAQGVYGLTTKGLVTARDVEAAQRRLGEASIVGVIVEAINLRLLGRFGEAEEVLRDALSKLGGNLWLRLELARVLEAGKRDDDALEAYRGILQVPWSAYPRRDPQPGRAL